jgi:hypothetical protein
MPSQGSGQKIVQRVKFFKESKIDPR